MFKRILSRVVSLLLVASIFLVGCSANVPQGLSGDYREDTIAVVESLRTALDLPDDSPDKSAAQAEAKGLINSYISRYRRDAKISGSQSFMTMATALNGLASHYNSSPNRPIPDKLKKRLEQEFKQIEIALRRESAA
ncbi:photosystem II protein Psb27 [Lyngbya confervoides]|uniref:Photosystem II lipoprotein Psb27 n=1 Tax=Lyngbya confervoides BDU141951 TaxID=1574623 RepID=A0ABD4T982_9CYAN|nr:photosystem II protein Psb27 [Lyngbya confervoides]MCM1985171.1 photosystem II protein Psb27 [Lyngbya confervoides BDU141951]